MSDIFGTENCINNYNFGSSFLPVQVYMFGSHLAENLYFWISLASNKEELNEKILNGRFKAILSST